MPKKVDPEQRRRAIARAVWRIAAKSGLEHVSMRRVAAEARVSTRLVQYYFGTRDQLLAGALSYRNDHDQVRIGRKAKLVGKTVRDLVRQTVLDLLPIDAEGRAMYLIHVAYFVRALNDPKIVAMLGGGRGVTLEQTFLDLLQAAERAGELKPGLDLELEAETLVALQDGMSSRLLLRLRSSTRAEEVLDYHLERLFRP
ncbi:MAG TPA: TetR/AcrR family transcriptional regulator [Polyangiales bacterium]|nr:TetR/AcrR family transcriptional regulator [Polyangiales bacterium]